MSRFFLLSGLRRSGLHACVNWVMGQCPGEVDLINDPPLDPTPLVSRIFHYRVASDSITAGITPALVDRIIKESNIALALSLPRPWRGLARRFVPRFWNRRLRPEHLRMPAFAQAPGRRADARLLLLENLPPAEIARSLGPWLDSHGLPAAPPLIPLVIRSPWNCLASHLKRPQLAPPRPVPPEAVREAWLADAHEALGRTRHFAALGSTALAVPYDRLISDPALRVDLSRRLGLEPSDLGLSAEADFGYGSSFGGPTDQLAQAVTLRWLRYRDHPLMRAILTDREVLELAAELGFTAPTN